jgi:uncharacterized protein
MKLFQLIVAIAFLTMNLKAQEQNVSQDYINYNSIKNFPQPVGWVNDFENVLSNSQAHILDSILSAYYQESLNPIALVTVNSIAPYHKMQDFSSDLSNHWGIKNNRNYGLIIIYSKNLNQVWFKPGTRTRKILNDDICFRIIDKSIQPYLVKQNYYEGLRQGIQACIEEWK